MIEIIFKLKKNIFRLITLLIISKTKNLCWKFNKKDGN